MKNKIKALLVALSLSAPAILSAADEATAQPTRPEVRSVRPVLPATLVVLDLNNDGVLDHAEIVNAAVALATLDANQDGSLTQEEFIGTPARQRTDAKTHGFRAPRPDRPQTQE